MRKKNKSKDRRFGIVWYIVLGIMIGELLTLLFVEYDRRDQDLIPKSTTGQTFSYINVEHCHNTYTNRCWIHDSEVEEFKKTNHWEFMVDFPDVMLVYR